MPGVKQIPLIDPVSPLPGQLFKKTSIQPLNVFTPHLVLEGLIVQIYIHIK